MRRALRAGAVMAKAILPESGLPILDKSLQEMAPYLGRPNLVEMCAVNFGELHLEFAGGRWQLERAPRLDRAYWSTLARSLNHAQDVPFDVENPIVSTRLPGGHRLDLMLGSSVESGISAAIRVNRRLRFPLEKYGLTAAQAEQLRSEVRNATNLIVSGGTSSGKTTLVNSMLTEIPPDERVITLEDVRELTCDHLKNRVHLVADRFGRRIGYDRFFDHLMRARPDRIISGEVSTKNAQPTLMLLSTGHKGFLTTLHSNSCREAIETAFHERLVLSGLSVDRPYLTQYLKRNVDLVIQVAKTPHGRRITEIWYPGREENPTTLYEADHA